jgi:hypothetical protein
MRTSYSEKLRLPAWQRKRLDIFQRDKFTCQLCQDTKTELQIHHKAYQKDREPWDYEDYYLTTLCKYCHAIVTELKINLFDQTPQVIKIGQGAMLQVFFIDLRGLHIYQVEPILLIGRYSHKTANNLTQALINFWNQNEM